MKRTLEIDAGMRHGRSMTGPQLKASEKVEDTSFEVESRSNFPVEATGSVSGNPYPRLRSVAGAGKPVTDRLRTPRS
jgi:hypothetical protein